MGLPVLSAVALALQLPLAGTASTAATVTPRSWWRFENASDPYADSQGAWPIKNPADRYNRTTWHDQSDGGVVGGYLDFGFVDPAKLGDPSRDWWEGNGGCTPFPCNDTTRKIEGFTIEFLLKPGPWLLRGGDMELFGELSYSKMPTVQISAASIMFTAATKPWPTPTASDPWDRMDVPLTRTGVQSPDYLADGQWHHFAFVKDASTGEQSIWIDGQRPPDFHRAANKSHAGRHFSSEGPISIGRVEESWNCSLDEMAIYESALPDELIYQHYADAMLHHRPYTMATTDLPPAPAPTPVGQDFDLTEFAPGTQIPTPAHNATQGVTVGAIEQLKRFPRPRFDAKAVDAHKMQRNFVSTCSP